MSLLSASSAYAFNCDNGIAEIGDSKYVIEQKCGEPDYTDHTQIGRIKETPTAFEQEFIAVEYWLYNPGPDRLVTVVMFEKGNAISMRTYGYGKSAGETPNRNKIIKTGVPTVMVLFLFGPPTHKEERIQTTIISRKDGASIPKMTHVQEWTYNYGPNRFMKICYFENGRLKRIERGSRGF